MSIEIEAGNLAQTTFYVVSPLVTLLAVFVAYLALLKQSRPHILVHYRPNPGVQSIIDLVVENIGNGMARDVVFSEPLPARCYGIEAPDGEGVEVFRGGIPAIAAGQQYLFDGGQYGGLAERLGESLEVKISYVYINPVGITCKRTESCVLSVSHLQSMTTRTSADQAIVDALKGPNKTTLQKIEGELHNIGTAIENLTDKLDEPKESD